MADETLLTIGATTGVLAKVRRGADDAGGARLDQSDCRSLLVILRALSEEDEDVHEDIPTSKGRAAESVRGLIEQHQVESHTQYGIPVFDEFDKSTRTYLRCKACLREVYQHEGNVCEARRELEKLLAILERG